VGGNIATNAGGMRAVKYGVTQRYVWGLQVVLAGGDVLMVGRHSIKGVAGLDITSLMVGSEGTLAMISQATLHIIPAPAAVETGWLTFPNAHSASRAAEAIFAAGCLPRIMEMMDREALDAIRGVSDFAIPEGAGAAMLLEMDGPEGEAFDDLVRAAEVASQAGATDSALARKEKDRQAMRRARRLVSSSLKERFPYKTSDDVAVPRSRMLELLERAEQACEGLRLCAYGHLGDGNLHLNILCATADERQASRAARRRILELAVALGGTISGEHGIGMAKREALSIEQTQSLIDLQRRVKSVFDPAGIMNPGKVLPPP
jgi:FAD/FMN-containing dehydrogenase